MSQSKAQLLDPQGDFTLTGQLIGVGATFSGNVSIGGTLTKQDVTNVDSVGIITARSGVNVTGGNVFIGQGGSGANNAELKLQAGAGTGNDIIAFLNQAGTTKGNLTYDTDNNFLLFNVNESERLRITSDGKVGINKSSPAEALDVAGAIQVSSAGLKLDTHPLVTYASFTAISGGTYAARLGSTGSSTIRSTQIYGGGSHIATFDGVNNRLGITSTAPEERLDLGNANKQNLKVGQRGYLGQAHSTSATILGHSVKADTTNSVADQMMVTESNSGGGAPSAIRQTTGSIQFHTASSGTADAVFSSERLRIGSAGQIGIAGANYGNAGQVLTSGGSGSIVSWVDAAGGAEFSGIASGSISTGNPVMVHPDGKLGKVKYNWNENITTGALAEGSSTIASVGAWGSWARNDDGTTWDGDGTSDDRVLFMFRYGNTPGYRTADYSGNTLTLNSLSSWNDGDGIAEWDAAYNSNGKRFAAVYRNNSNGRARFVVGRPSGTSVTWGTGTNGSSGRLEISSDSTTNAVGVEYAGNDKFVVGYGVGNKVYAQVVTNSSGSNYMTLSAGSRTEIEDIGAAVTYKIHITKPDSNGRMILFYMKPLGGDFGLKMAVLTISGTSVSYDGRAWVSSSNTVYTRPAAKTSYDPNEDRYLLIYERMSNNRMYGRNMKITAADAISMSAETQLHDQNPEDQGGDTVYDTNLKKHFVYLTNAPTSKLSYVPVTFTGSAAPTAGTLGIIYNNAQILRSFITEFDPTLGKILLASRNQSSSGSGDYLGALITSTATSETNLTRNNFIGFSKGNYTDGNTAKVNVNGSVDENQSSLTPGQTYFVKEDGTLSLTTDKTRVAAGQAVSSTNLIVRDENPRQGILGFWQYHLQEQGSAYKPWCACRYVGGYARDQNGNCNFCTGKWTPWCCNGTAVNSGQQHVWDIPDENGGNMCISCGGLSKGSQFCMHTGACCCCCPDGRFYFPSTGLYCYNFDMMWLSCQQMAVGGCWNVSTLWNGRKCHNNACDQCMWSIQNWRGNPNTCLYCESRMWANNIFISGMVSVADPAANFIVWKVCDSSIGVQIRNNGFFQCEAGMQQVSNWVNFTKLSNSPGSYYCN